MVLYNHYGEKLSGQWAWLAEKFSNEAKESFGHSIKVASILSYLGEEIPRTIEFPEVRQTDNVKEMLEEAFKNEETAAKTYKEILEEVKNEDYFVEHEVQHLLKAELEGMDEVKRWKGN